MLILTVIPSIDPTKGGPSECIINLIPELNKYGFIHDVVCLDNPNAAFLQNTSFKTYALGDAKNAWNYNKKLIPWLRKNVLRYDMVVVHTLWGYHGYAVNKVLKELRNKNSRYYVMPHGMLDPYFQTAKERKLKAIRNLFYWAFIEKKVINEAEGILFTCDAERQLAQKTFNNYHPKKEIIVGIGIYSPPSKQASFVDAFYKALNTSKRNPYILFLSRIDCKKGIDILITAYAKIVEANNLETLPDLVIAGSGIEKEFGLTIQKMVTSNKLLEGKVHFPGMLRDEAKWGAFYGSEAFILPSHQENFGIVVVEALACKKVVLITDKVNIYSVIKDEQAGIVESDNEEGIYNLLNNWLHLSAQEKNNMSLNAFNCFQKHYTIQNTALNFKKLYEEYTVPTATQHPSSMKINLYNSKPSVV